MQEFFHCLKHLPYEATASLTAVLKYLVTQDMITNRWKVCLLLMGLMFHNPNARSAWFIMYSNLLYTWELNTKFRKPIAAKSVIFYRDTPSTNSAYSDERQLELLNNL